MRVLWGPLLGMLEGLWLFLGIVWVQNGARNVKMKVYLAQVEVARWSQRLSGFDFETILKIVVFFLVRKALCMQFGDDFIMAFQHGCSVTLQLLFSMC